MPSPIIKVTDLSKSYTLNHEGTERYTALRDVVTNKVKKLFSFPKSLLTPKQLNNSTTEEFWALKDINFEIQQGDRVGIIGRNGAGKSTLLKILSRITEPTKGRIELNGRVASLLEVGTGFHPELTGRENIFLNGAILGMSRAEIKRKFDEIVDFAEVERFLDTPVKRYSSGMYVRLAFAVAAHLEPEILIVDEVLAVGDAQFQKKCLGKMEDVSKNEGRTILFVSHNMGVVSQLCSKSILLENGSLIKNGETAKIIDLYLQRDNGKVVKVERESKVIGNHFRYIQMVDTSMDSKMDFAFDEDICVRIIVNIPENNPNLELAMRLINRNKNAVFTIHEKLETFKDENSSINILVTIPKKYLTSGLYSWVMCINHPGLRLFDLQDDILPFNVIDTGSDFARYEGADYGSVFANYKIDKIE